MIPACVLPTIFCLIAISKLSVRSACLHAKVLFVACFKLSSSAFVVSRVAATNFHISAWLSLCSKSPVLAFGVLGGLFVNGLSICMKTPGIMSGRKHVVRQKSSIIGARLR